MKISITPNILDLSHASCLPFQAQWIYGAYGTVQCPGLVGDKFSGLASTNCIIPRQHVISELLHASAYEFVHFMQCCNLSRWHRRLLDQYLVPEAHCRHNMRGSSIIGAAIPKYSKEVILDNCSQVDVDVSSVGCRKSCSVSCGKGNVLPLDYV